MNNPIDEKPATRQEECETAMQGIENPITFMEDVHTFFSKLRPDTLLLVHDQIDQAINGPKPYAGRVEPPVKGESSPTFREIFEGMQEALDHVDP